jgi:hypothetical protein
MMIGSLGRLDDGTFHCMCMRHSHTTSWIKDELCPVVRYPCIAMPVGPYRRSSWASHVSTGNSAFDRTVMASLATAIHQGSRRRLCVSRAPHGVDTGVGHVDSISDASSSKTPRQSQVHILQRIVCRTTKDGCERKCRRAQKWTGYMLIPPGIELQRPHGKWGSRATYTRSMGSVKTEDSSQHGPERNILWKSTLTCSNLPNAPNSRTFSTSRRQAG